MWIRSHRSATFRLSLRTIPLYLGLGWALLVFVYVSTLSIIDRRVEAGLTAERRRVLEDLRGADSDAVATAIRARILAERGSARLYLLRGGGGETLAANFTVAAENVPAAGHFALVPARRQDADIEAGLLTVGLAQGLSVVLGRDLDEEQRFRHVIETTMGLAAVLTVVLAAVAGRFTSRAVLARLGAMNATAERILLGDLRERMPVTGAHDEFSLLAKTLNQSLDRIADLMQATRQVTDNIAHDLRSPLARIRNRMELALVKTASREKLEEVIACSVEDIDQVLETFESLLAISRIEHGIGDDFEPVDVAELVSDLIDYFQPLAEEKGLSLEAAPDGGIVPGDRNLLFQALSNLVDNAIRYTPAGGAILVSVARRGETVTIGVADNGPGIPPDRRAEVLKRFVRLDASRHRPGNGLGLAVVDAVARHHHARLELGDNGPGLLVSLTLPAIPDKLSGRT